MENTNLRVTPQSCPTDWHNHMENTEIQYTAYIQWWAVVN